MASSTDLSSHFDAIVTTEQNAYAFYGDGYSAVTKLMQQTYGKGTNAWDTLGAYLQKIPIVVAEQDVPLCLAAVFTKTAEYPFQLDEVLAMLRKAANAEELLKTVDTIDSMDPESAGLKRCLVKLHELKLNFAKYRVDGSALEHGPVRRLVDQMGGLATLMETQRSTLNSIMERFVAIMDMYRKEERLHPAPSITASMDARINKLRDNILEQAAKALRIPQGDVLMPGNMPILRRKPRVGTKQRNGIEYKCWVTDWFASTEKKGETQIAGIDESGDTSTVSRVLMMSSLLATALKAITAYTDMATTEFPNQYPSLNQMEEFIKDADATLNVYGGTFQTLQNRSDETLATLNAELKVAEMELKQLQISLSNFSATTFKHLEANTQAQAECWERIAEQQAQLRKLAEERLNWTRERVAECEAMNQRRSDLIKQIDRLRSCVIPTMESIRGHCTTAVQYKDTMKLLARELHKDSIDKRVKGTSYLSGIAKHALDEQKYMHDSWMRFWSEVNHPFVKDHVHYLQELDKAVAKATERVAFCHDTVDPAELDYRVSRTILVEMRGDAMDALEMMLKHVTDITNENVNTPTKSTVNQDAFKVFLNWLTESTTSFRQIATPPIVDRIFEAAAIPQKEETAPTQYQPPPECPVWSRSSTPFNALRSAKGGLGGLGDGEEDEFDMGPRAAEILLSPPIYNRWYQELDEISSVKIKPPPLVHYGHVPPRTAPPRIYIKERMGLPVEPLLHHRKSSDGTISLPSMLSSLSTVATGPNRHIASLANDIALVAGPAVAATNQNTSAAGSNRKDHQRGSKPQRLSTLTAQL